MKSSAVKPQHLKRKNKHFFQNLAVKITLFTGSTRGFLFACLIILIWIVTGPLFHFSDTWQLVINTGTTIVTFLMVFLIQRLQNKDGIAIQIKLDELIAATKGASNRLIDSEDLTEEELNILHSYYRILEKRTEREKDIRKTHSVEEAIKKPDKKKDN